MKIPLPNKLLDRAEIWWEPIGSWINVPIYKKVRRIDILLLLLGVICTGYYGYTSGWQGALLGGLFYVLVLMLVLWFF